MTVAEATQDLRGFTPLQAMSLWQTQDVRLPQSSEAFCLADLPSFLPDVVCPTSEPVAPKSGGVSVALRDSLYAEFRPLVKRLIRKYGDNPSLREDMEGEIFCLFSELLALYDPERGVPLKPYLVRQLTASVYTMARKRWRQEQREVVSEVREDVSEESDPSRKWDDEMLMQQVQELLPGAISGLPQRQRQVVIWRYYEHRSFEEIAVALGGVQVATARSLLRHGLNSLRRNLTKSGLSFPGDEQ